MVQGFNLIRGAKILVAEDNEINQQVIKETLENEGFVVDIAKDGKETVTMYEDNLDYDVILNPNEKKEINFLVDTSYPIYTNFTESILTTNVFASDKSFSVLSFLLI